MQGERETERKKKETERKRMESVAPNCLTNISVKTKLQYREKHNHLVSGQKQYGHKFASMLKLLKIAQFILR